MAQHRVPPGPSVTLDELAGTPLLAAELSEADHRVLVLQASAAIARASAALAALAAAPPPERNRPPGDNDQMLTVEQVAKLLEMSSHWVYRNWQELGGTKLGGSLRFSLAGLRSFIAKKRR